MSDETETAKQGGNPHLSGFPVAAARVGERLKLLGEVEVREDFHLGDDERLLKTTVSACGNCLAAVPAAIVARDGKVFMHKLCKVHGVALSLVENDEAFYRISSLDSCGKIYADDARVTWPEFQEESPSCCSGGCGSRGKPDPGLDYFDQSSNKTCTVLVEITNACDLACRVCYADAKGDRILSLTAYQDQIHRLLEQKGGLESVQITGGEASLHPDFWEMLAWTCEQEKIAKVYLPTNGVAMSRPENIQRLRKFRKKVLVLLQLDGQAAETNMALRASNPVKQKLKLIRELERVRVPMQLTMTLARGVSEQEISWVVRQGIRHRNVRLVAILPAFQTGRFDIDSNPLQRLTLSDAIKGVSGALPNRVSRDSFMTIPCSHPNCGWTALFARRFGFFVNISGFVNRASASQQAAYRTQLKKGELRRLLGGGGVFKRFVSLAGKWLIRPQDVFGIVIKPFMDSQSFDYDRVSNCCHHVLDTRGQLISFCEYNVRLREKDDWSKLSRMNEAVKTSVTAKERQ